MSDGQPVVVVPQKKYRAIYADPPWKMSGGKNGKGGWSKSVSPDAHYPLLNLDKILLLPISELALPDSFLFLWVLNGMLQEGLDVMKAWGFKYKNNLCWRKTTGYGIGQYIRGDHELLLMGIRGKPGYARDAKGKRVQVRSIVESPRGRHSEKPEEMRTRVEKISGSNGPFLELFARKASPNWDVWGNEVKPDVEIIVPEE